MIKFDVSSTFRSDAGRVRELGRQLPFVTAVALTKTAREFQSDLKVEMGQVFDRPVPYTLNSTFLKAATKQSQEARVWLKDNPAGKGTPADRYLAPQVYGGGRRQKGFERALQRAGMLGASMVAIPAAGAQIDGNGNVKRSQIVQILSQLKVQGKAGYESKASDSAASRRAVARQGVTYFVLPVARRGLAAGIYLKRQFAHGSAIRPVFLFVASAQYRKRLRFFELGEAAALERFPYHFDRAADAEIRKAGLR